MIVEVSTEDPYYIYTPRVSGIGVTRVCLVVYSSVVYSSVVCVCVCVCVVVCSLLGDLTCTKRYNIFRYVYLYYSSGFIAEIDSTRSCTTHVRQPAIASRHFTETIFVMCTCVMYAVIMIIIYNHKQFEFPIFLRKTTNIARRFTPKSEDTTNFIIRAYHQMFSTKSILENFILWLLRKQWFSRIHVYYIIEYIFIICLIVISF